MDPMGPHYCTGCGEMHGAEPEMSYAEAEVKVAQIGADRDVELAKEATRAAETWQESRVAELEGEVRGMRTVLDRIAPPEPDPAEELPPVEVVDEPAAEEPVVEVIEEEAPPMEVAAAPGGDEDQGAKPSPRRESKTAQNVWYR